MSDLGIGQRVAALRKERGMTLEDVAQRSGLAKSWVWEVEKGKQKSPTISTVVALARAFAVSVDSLCGFSTQAVELHPEAMRVAIQVDTALRQQAARMAVAAYDLPSYGKFSGGTIATDQTGLAIPGSPYDRGRYEARQAIEALTTTSS